MVPRKLYQAALRTVIGKRKEAVSAHLLSDDVGIMGSFPLEGAVVGPEIHRGRDTGNTTLIDLKSMISRAQSRERLLPMEVCSYHFSGLGASNRKL